MAQQIYSHRRVMNAFHRIVAKTAAKIVSGRDMYTVDEPFQSTGT